MAKKLSSKYKIAGYGASGRANMFCNLTCLDENIIHRVDAISGSFMMFPRQILTDVGKFDESYFMYGEDLDYCYRIQNSGYQIIYNPESSIIHYKGESVKSVPQDMIAVFYESMNIFFDK